MGCYHGVIFTLDEFFSELTPKISSVSCAEFSSQLCARLSKYFQEGCSGSHCKEMLSIFMVDKLKFIREWRALESCLKNIFRNCVWPGADGTLNHWDDLMFLWKCLAELSGLPVFGYPADFFYFHSESFYYNSENSDGCDFPKDEVLVIFKSDGLFVLSDKGKQLADFMNSGGLSISSFPHKDYLDF